MGDPGVPGEKGGLGLPGLPVRAHSMMYSLEKKWLAKELYSQLYSARNCQTIFIL
jgi:hypothetical protein